MKRMLLPPIFVLAALLAFSLWNIRHMEGETDRWREQLQAADRLALSGEWAEALDALWESYDDWSHSQTYLHIVSHHDAVDDAEAMYRRPSPSGKRRSFRSSTRSCPTSGTSCGSLRRWKR